MKIAKSEREKMAKRETRFHGWILRKSRARNWKYIDQLGYCIYDPWKKRPVIGDNFELTLEDVEKFLEENPYMT